MLRLGAAVFALGLAAAISGCGQAQPTQLIIVVDTDFSIPTELNEVQIDVTGPDGMLHAEHQAVSSTSDMPRTLTVVPNGSSLGPVLVVARGLHDGTVRVTRTGRVMLEAQQSLTMPMFLLRVCDGMTCDATHTCGDDGQCGSLEATTLPWSGTPLRIGDDAGVHDAGPIDSGLHPMDVGPHDAGPNAPDMGVPNDAFVVDCRTTGCDDHEPCTDDACNADGTCTHTNNTIACDDHLFCNGMDTCGGGTCSAHVGNPCVAGTCDEPTGRCIGCGSDADCPAQMTGAFGACGNFPSTCATDGTHSRTVRTFHCTSNACTPTDTTDTQACTRATDGTSCGTSSCGSFGACGGFSGTCGTSGTQSRTCTDLTCSAGSCGSSMRTDTQGCSRSTDGTSCMATSCGAWSACGGFADECANGGTQSRTCTDYACSGGGCSASAPRTETQACSRNTNGTACGAGTSCGAFGACPAYADTCATSSSQSRTCTDYACSNGTCNGTPRTDTQVCMTRATDGVLCMNDPDNCQRIYCQGGTCSRGQTTCSGSTRCCYPGCYSGPCP